jgi:uncharacterized membrane protein
MYSVTVAVFEKSSGAARIIKEFRHMPDIHREGISDACAVFRNHEGGLTLDQMVDRADRFFMAGLFIGGLIGFTIGYSIWGWPVSLLTSITGAIVGLGLATLAAALTDYGLDDDFIQKVASELPPESSAIIVLHKPQTASRFRAIMAKSGGQVYQTRYSERTQEKLQSVLANHLRTVPDGKPRVHNETL